MGHGNREVVELEIFLDKDEFEKIKSYCNEYNIKLQDFISLALNSYMELTNIVNPLILE